MKSTKQRLERLEQRAGATGEGGTDWGKVEVYEELLRFVPLPEPEDEQAFERLLEPQSLGRIIASNRQSQGAIESAEWEGKLHAVLIEDGALTEEQWDAALAKANELPRVDSDRAGAAPDGLTDSTPQQSTNADGATPPIEAAADHDDVQEPSAQPEKQGPFIPPTYRPPFQWTPTQNTPPDGYQHTRGGTIAGIGEDE